MSVESESEMSSDDCVETIDDVVNLAMKEYRLTRGIFKCAYVLERYPEIVSLCLLPNLSTVQIGTIIQHKLIEAYCLENEIRIVHVDNAKLASFVKQCNKTSEHLDVDCILVTTISTKTIHQHMDDNGLYDDDDSG